jgi:hypothetical protein
MGKFKPKRALPSEKPYSKGTLEEKKEDKLFKIASKIILIGRSGAGKSLFLFKCLVHKLFEAPIATIYLCAPNPNSDLLDMMEAYLRETGSHISLIFHLGVPNATEYLGWMRQQTGPGQMLLILDDLFLQASSSTDIVDLFTVHSRHANISVALTAHSFRERHAQHLNILKFNATHIILFSNPMANVEIYELAKSLIPTKPRLLNVIFNSATCDGAYGYLVIDLSPGLTLCQRFRTSIFPGEPEKQLGQVFSKFPDVCGCSNCSESVTASVGCLGRRGRK